MTHTHTWNQGEYIPKGNWHFHRRLYERYKIVLEPGEFSIIYKDICLEGKGKIIKSVSVYRPYQLFKYQLNREDKTRRIYILIHTNPKRLVTVYEPKWVSHVRKPAWENKKSKRRNKKT